MSDHRTRAIVLKNWIYTRYSMRGLGVSCTNCGAELARGQTVVTKQTSGSRKRKLYCMECARKLLLV